MGMFYFYNNRKPRKFNYQPILYNPDEEARQERLQKRITEIKREMGAELSEKDKTVNPDIKEEFLQQTTHLQRRKEREAAGKKAFFTNNGLLFLILILLLAIFFFWILR